MPSSREGLFKFQPHCQHRRRRAAGSSRRTMWDRRNASLRHVGPRLAAPCARKPMLVGAFRIEGDHAIQYRCRRVCAVSAPSGKRMMYMRLQPSILLLGIFLATSPLVAADRGFYAGAGIGQMNVEVDNMYGSSFDFDEDDFGFKLFGGYRFFPWLSVEGIFLDGGNPEVRDTAGAESASLSLQVQSLVAAAVFSLPIGDQFESSSSPASHTGTQQRTSATARRHSPTASRTTTAAALSSLVLARVGRLVTLGCVSSTNGSTSPRSTTSTPMNWTMNWTHPRVSSR